MAESRMDQMDNQINALQREWQDQLGFVRQEAERVLGEDEIREFNTRIAILKQELDCKN